MCIVSAVYDHFNPLIPEPDKIWPTPIWPEPTAPAIPLVISPQLPDMKELRELVNKFHEAVEAAKKLDIIMKQPDCVDPDKQKLEDRVAELERRLSEIEKGR